MFTNEPNIGLLPQIRVEKRVHRMEIHWLSSKEKVSGAVVSKEGNADNFLEYEKTHTIEFHEKDATINNASYCELLWQNSPFLLNDLRIHQISMDTWILGQNLSREFLSCFISYLLL